MTAANALADATTPVLTVPSDTGDTGRPTSEPTLGVRTWRASGSVRFGGDEGAELGLSKGLTGSLNGSEFVAVCDLTGADGPGPSVRLREPPADAGGVGKEPETLSMPGAFADPGSGLPKSGEN